LVGVVVEKTLFPNADISGLTLPSTTGPKLLKLVILSVAVSAATSILFFALLPLDVIVDHPPAQDV
jgi:hypothetical protein